MLSTDQLPRTASELRAEWGREQLEPLRLGLLTPLRRLRAPRRLLQPDFARPKTKLPAQLP